MSRRKRAKSAVVVAAPPSPGADLLRRALLGLATALIVAAALLPVDDPGLLDPTSNPLALTVTLGWLLGLLGWAVWRWWSGRVAWYAGSVEAGLFALVFLSFLSTVTAASARHVAWVIAWQGAGLFAAFFLVRQVARSAADLRGLLAALLATGVCLATQTLVERVRQRPATAPLGAVAAEDWPRFRCFILGTMGAGSGPLPTAGLVLAAGDDDPASYQRLALGHNVTPETGEAALPAALRPTPPSPVTATFRSEEALAGFFALLLPVLGGCAVAAWLGGAPPWRRTLALACVAVVALALLLTFRLSAVLPCLLVGAAAAALAWRYAPRPSPRLLLLSLGGIAAALALAVGLRARGGDDVAGAVASWGTALKVIQKHPVLGVGPGNYVRHAPEFASQTRPRNFLLEVAAEGGLFALLALLGTLAAFLRRTRAAAARPDAEPDVEPGTRWEFYEGGLVGLVGGFFLRALPLPADEIAAEAVAAALRAPLWFAAFALLSEVRWAGPTRVLAGAAGVAALLLHLTVDGSLAVLGVTGPLLILMALTLNGVAEEPLAVGDGLVGRVLPVALAGAALLAFLMQVFEPVTNAAAGRRDALLVAQHYFDLRGGVYPHDDAAKRPRLRDAGSVLGHVATELTKAVKADPANPRLRVDAANAFGWLSEAFPENPAYLGEALGYARQAQRLDPRGPDGYYAEAQLLLTAARPRAGTMESLKPGFAEVAPTPLGKLTAYRPTDARLRARYAEALWLAGDAERAAPQGRLALDLDVTAPQLSESERRRLRARLDAAVASPPRKD